MEEKLIKITKIERKVILSNSEMINDLSYKAFSTGLTKVEFSHFISIIRHITDVMTQAKKREKVKP